MQILSIHAVKGFLFDKPSVDFYSTAIIVSVNHNGGNQMKRLLGVWMIVVMASLLLLPAVGINEAHAGKLNPSIGSGFRCGNLMMEEGLEKLQVLAECGDPVATEKSWIDKYGEVEKLVYGPDAGYFYILYFFHGNMIGIEEVRQ
jgi:hypothetical protein